MTARDRYVPAFLNRSTAMVGREGARRIVCACGCRRWTWQSRHGRPLKYVAWDCRPPRKEAV